MQPGHHRASYKPDHRHQHAPPRPCQRTAAATGAPPAPGSMRSSSSSLPGSASSSFRIWAVLARSSCREGHGEQGEVRVAERRLGAAAACALQHKVLPAGNDMFPCGCSSRAGRAQPQAESRAGTACRRQPHLDAANVLVNPGNAGRHRRRRACSRQDLHGRRRAGQPRAHCRGYVGELDQQQARLHMHCGPGAAASAQVDARHAQSGPQRRHSGWLTLTRRDGREHRAARCSCKGAERVGHSDTVRPR